MRVSSSVCIEKTKSPSRVREKGSSMVGRSALLYDHLTGSREGIGIETVVQHTAGG